MPEILTINLTTFNDEERKAIGELKAKRHLSKVVSTALHEYLERQKPNQASAIMIISTTKDIEKYVVEVVNRTPKTQTQLKRLREFVQSKLDEGYSIEVNLDTGKTEYIKRGIGLASPEAEGSVIQSHYGDAIDKWNKREDT